MARETAERVSTCSPKVSGVPYALLVPVFLVLVHDARLVLDGGSARDSLLLILLREVPPLILVALVAMAAFSLPVIQPFAERKILRWFAVAFCVLVFSLLISLLPKLVE